MAEEFTILTVCTGNVHRSPLAAILLEQWADWYLPESTAASVRVASAGLAAAVGSRMDDRLLRVAEDLGADGSAHRASQFDERAAASASLVLTATRRQRDEVVSRAPSALRRAFTIREAGRLARLVAADQPPNRGGDLGAVVRRLASARTADAADDVLDPQGRGDDAYVQMVEEEVPPLALLAVTLFGMPLQDLEAYKLAATDRAALTERIAGAGHRA